ncbi:unnamed protein product [Adineta steineri]|uniref:Uncharacterized protein n=1 Tax=Adineta steineri TaxID=433720 RepID=A0A814A973_9BILA|nr:unnamed protein product [Adineta steineri]
MSLFALSCKQIQMEAILFNRQFRRFENDFSSVEHVNIHGIQSQRCRLQFRLSNDIQTHLPLESRDVDSAISSGQFDLESFTAHMINMDNNGQFRQKLCRADAEAGSVDPCHRLLMLKFVHLVDDAGYSVEKRMIRKHEYILDSFQQIMQL